MVNETEFVQDPRIAEQVGELRGGLEAALNRVRILERLLKRDWSSDEPELLDPEEAVRFFGEPEVPAPAVWRTMSKALRVEWDRRYSFAGYVSFVCLTCGYPTASGQAWCEACRPKEGEG